jgi:hypothetical protein
MPIKHTLTASSGSTLTSAHWNADHTITTTDLISNLNADMIDGYHAVDLLGMFNPFSTNTVPVVVSETTDTPKRTLYMWKDTLVLGSPSSLIVENEGGIASGNFYIYSYLDGSSIGASTFTTASSIKTVAYNITSLTNLTMHTIRLDMKVSSGSGTNRVSSIFLK